MQSAISAYRAGAQLADDPRQVLYLLHDGAARELRSAKFAYEQKALDQTCRHVLRAHQIIAALLTHLRFEVAGIEGARVKTLYLMLTRRLLRVMSDSNVTEALQHCADILQMLRDGSDKEIQVQTLQYK